MVTVPMAMTMSATFEKKPVSYKLYEVLELAS